MLLLIDIYLFTLVSARHDNQMGKLDECSNIPSSKDLPIPDIDSVIQNARYECSCGFIAIIIQIKASERTSFIHFIGSNH